VCENLLIESKEEHRFRVFENRVLRKIFGPKKDEVTGEWRKLHNKELDNLYLSPNIIRVVKSRRRWAGNVVRMRKSCMQGFSGKTVGNTQLGRPKHRWEDNIKVDLKERGWSGFDWIDLSQERDKIGTVLKYIINIRVP
jgi:hypothetical protein